MLVLLSWVIARIRFRHVLLVNVWGFGWEIFWFDWRSLEMLMSLRLHSQKIGNHWWHLWSHRHSLSITLVIHLCVELSCLHAFLVLNWHLVITRLLLNLIIRKRTASRSNGLLLDNLDNFGWWSLSFATAEAVLALGEVFTVTTFADPVFMDHCFGHWLLVVILIILMLLVLCIKVR